ncbi:MAG: efflux RND transporter periplasmic adaptor subunit [Bacteroidales bacterium]
MRKIDRRIVIVVSALFILLLAYGIMRFLAAQRPPDPVRQSVEARRFVRFELVDYEDIPATVTERGRVSSVAEVDIVSEASGKIEQGTVPLKKGAGFSKGNVLFVVYPDEAILALKARKSRYQNTLASILPDLAIDYPQYEEAYQQFFNSISVDKPLPDLPEINNDQLKIFLASRNVISEYYGIQSDELQLKRRTVTAPFDGTFTEVYMEVGAYTNAGGRVATTIRTDQLEIEVALRRSFAIWVKIGDPVSVMSDDGSVTWEGKVIRKSKFVDENTQRQSIFVRVNNGSSQPLMAGEYLDATFPVQPIKNVMEIPRNAVFNFDEVFLVKSGRLAKASINVVKENERTYLINGLNEGDTLVVQQLINVSEGTLVVTDADQGPGPGMGPGSPGGPGQPRAGNPGSQERQRSENRSPQN